MNIFLSDLDNTLIYSHRRNISGKKTAIEYLDGREQSYVTEKTLLLLRTFCSKEGSLLVPVTTRTYSQYSRLRPLSDMLGIKYALVCNGAELYVNGKSDDLWREESMRLIQPLSAELIRCCNILKRFTDESHVHYIEPYMVYCKPENPQQSIEALNAAHLSDGMSIIFTSGKLYCLPEVLSKGNAARRFIARFPDKDISLISAGDSEFDISMLSVSDISFAPEKLMLPSCGIKDCTVINGIFSNGLCERLIRL